jgi:hypothetical protein
MKARIGMRYTYSGTVKAATSAAALIKARELGANQPHPFKTGSEEVIDTVSTLLVDGQRFAQVTFSYEYEGPLTQFIFAEITSDRNTSLFGDWRTVISGSITAPSTAAARGLMTSLLSSYSAATAVESSEQESELAQSISATITRAAMNLKFSRSYPMVHTRTAAKFTDDTSLDYGAMIQIRTITGTLWTNSRSNSETALNALLGTRYAGASIQKLKKSHAIESWAPDGTFTSLTNERWVQLDFSAEATMKITGEPGFDIIEAKFTISRTGSINRTVLHEIPMGRPIAQVGIGYNVATLQISATCKARTEAAARQYVQGLRNLVNNIGTAGTTRHEASPPQETVSPDFAPFPVTGASPTVFVFTGSYSYSFSGALSQNDGIWPTTYLPEFKI